MNRNAKILLIISLFIFIVCSLVTMLNGDKEIIYTNLYLISYFSLIIFYILKENKKLVSIKSLYVLMYSLMFGLSPLFYIIKNKSFFIKKNSIIYQYPIAVIGLIVLILAYYIPLSRKKSVKNVDDRDIFKYEYFISISLIIFSTIFNYIYINHNKLLFFSNNLESSRIDALSGNGLIIMLAGLNLIGTAMLFDYYVKTGKKIIPLLISLVLFIIIYIIRGSRTPILRLFIIMVFIYNNKKKIKLKTAFLLVIISISVLSVLLIFRTSLSGGNISFFNSLFSNLQIGTINFNYVHNTFPRIVPYQKGTSFLINIKMMLPGDDPDFTLWLKRVIGISFSGGGVTPTIFGEGYLNFGMIGGYIEIFIIGLLGRKFDKNYLDKNLNTFWTIYLSIIMLDVFRGGFANVEISLLLTFALYITCSTLQKMSEKSYNESLN